MADSVTSDDGAEPFQPDVLEDSDTTASEVGSSRGTSTALSERRENEDREGFASRSCLACHNLKRRCDRQLPQCSLCAKFRRECLYTPSKRQVNALKKGIDELSERIYDLEDVIRDAKMDIQQLVNLLKSENAFGHEDASESSTSIQVKGNIMDTSELLRLPASIRRAPSGISILFKNGEISNIQELINRLESLELGRKARESTSFSIEQNAKSEEESEQDEVFKAPKSPNEKEFGRDIMYKYLITSNPLTETSMAVEHDLGELVRATFKTLFDCYYPIYPIFHYPLAKEALRQLEAQNTLNSNIFVNALVATVIEHTLLLHGDTAKHMDRSMGISNGETLAASIASQYFDRAKITLSESFDELRETTLYGLVLMDIYQARYHPRISDPLLYYKLALRVLHSLPELAEYPQDPSALTGAERRQRLLGYLYHRDILYQMYGHKNMYIEPRPRLDVSMRTSLDSQERLFGVCFVNMLRTATLMLDLIHEFYTESEKRIPFDRAQAYHKSNDVIYHDRPGELASIERLMTAWMANPNDTLWPWNGSKTTLLLAVYAYANYHSFLVEAYKFFARGCPPDDVRLLSPGDHTRAAVFSPQTSPSNSFRSVISSDHPPSPSRRSSSSISITSTAEADATHICYWSALSVYAALHVHRVNNLHDLDSLGILNHVSVASLIFRRIVEQGADEAHPPAYIREIRSWLAWEKAEIEASVGFRIGIRSWRQYASELGKFLE
ncbi:hypothetical protein BZG36_04855 [Bifiguratus adelaidae]|uniref:Zn(2)-C6 fungal-type domain-containing protein n=1 Tax=Bifiguratus adelaidae TaxID=1938954 RepID=A0A261XVY9_9FUNG|nr:hypothetical protein BZG36_04855 [Bifiguratus adelaidae]